MRTAKKSKEKGDWMKEGLVLSGEKVSGIILR